MGKRTIRVRRFKAGGMKEDGYITAELLEFHPDTDYRAKFRGYALVRSHPELLHSEHAHVYTVCGAGYLENPYIHINELHIHPLDVRDLTDEYRRTGKHITIEKQPKPFPMYKKGTRVVVVPYKDTHVDTSEFAGQIATIAESSPGGMSSVVLDNVALMGGFKKRHFPSIALKEIKA